MGRLVLTMRRAVRGIFKTSPELSDKWGLLVKEMPRLKDLIPLDHVGIDGPQMVRLIDKSLVEERGQELPDLGTYLYLTGKRGEYVADLYLTGTMTREHWARIFRKLLSLRNADAVRRVVRVWYTRSGWQRGKGYVSQAHVQVLKLPLGLSASEFAERTLYYLDREIIEEEEKAAAAKLAEINAFLEQIRDH